MSTAILVMRGVEDRIERGPQASHTGCALTYLLDGWFEVDHGQPIRVAPDTVTIVPAGIPHRMLDGRNLDYWHVEFCPSCLELDEGQRLMSPFRRVRCGAFPVVSVPSGRRRRLRQWLTAMREEHERGAPDSPELMRCLLLLVLAEVRRAMPGAASTEAVGSLVGDVLEFIQGRSLEPISLSDVARSVGRSPAHVTATLKKATGYSVGQWIAAARVAEAATRLAHTADSLDEIAVHVGWQDKTHFIRQFKKAYGTTPAEWRRQHRAGHEHG